MFKMRVNYVETGLYFSKQLDVLLLKHTFFFLQVSVSFTLWNTLMFRQKNLFQAFSFVPWHTGC